MEITTEQRICKMLKLTAEIATLTTRLSGLKKKDTNRRGIEKDIAKFSDLLGAMAWGGWVLSQRDEYKYLGDHFPCLYQLQQRQSQSADWAMAHEGWKVEQVPVYVARLKALEKKDEGFYIKQLNRMSADHQLFLDNPILFKHAE